MVDAYEMQREAQMRYRHKRLGASSEPVASLLRDYNTETDRKTFGAVLLIQDSLSDELLITRWLCKDVTEQEAREAINDYNHRAVS